MLHINVNGQDANRPWGKAKCFISIETLCFVLYFMYTKSYSIPINTSTRFNPSDINTYTQVRQYSISNASARSYSSVRYTIFVCNTIYNLLCYIAIYIALQMYPWCQLCRDYNARFVYDPMISFKYLFYDHVIIGTMILLYHHSNQSNIQWWSCKTINRFYSLGLSLIQLTWTFHIIMTSAFISHWSFFHCEFAVYTCQMFWEKIL